MIKRLTWLIHNTLMTPFIPVRFVLFAFIRIGEAADWALEHTPGLRRWNGW